MTFSKYALLMNPLARSIEELLPVRVANSCWCFVLLRAALVMSTVGSAFLLPYFSSVMALTGSLLCVLVAVIMPALCFLRIVKKKATIIQVIMCTSIVVLGIVCAVMGTYSSALTFSRFSSSALTVGIPLTVATNRKYRHHSPVDSSSSDGSPKHKHSLSPVSLKEEAKVSNFQSRKGDRSNARGSNRNQHGRSNDSYEYSSRSSQGYSLRDGHSRHGKHADEDDRNYSRLSSRSAREPRGSSHSDCKEREGDYIMSRDHHGDGDKYTRDKSDSVGYTSKDKEREKPSQDYRKFRYKDSSSDRRHDKLTAEENRYDDHDRHVRDRDNRDGKRDYSWSSRVHKGDRTTFYGEYTGRRGDTDSERDGGGYHMKESFKGEAKELDSKKEKKKYDGQDINRNKDAPGTELGERFEKGSGFASEIEESAAKRHKLFNLDKYTDQRTEGSKHVQEPVGKVTADHAPVSCSESATNVNAAKVAAMKAAELVNKDLLGTGVMTADQKKKLLWGNKKSSSSEESSHRWDTTLFSDRDRQEKFNKLMGVKGEVKVEQRPMNEDGTDLLRAEKQRELQLDLEKQYTAGLRRRDGRTVGLGL
ncbi:hypothetical protein Nepgr_031254 [Nepenthes gracilis]|uniref:Small acidic protein-like domain-containing protein n=1 Tax=Nepenthes gracilis TaxID=150966 RepID=A0AAD3THS0_NEPGR|nr:hypothetical protein Nepgr_031254 [Nepenthes gracilis]